MSHSFDSSIELSDRNQGCLNGCSGSKPTHGHMRNICMGAREVHLKWAGIKPLMHLDDRLVATPDHQEKVFAFGARDPIQAKRERRYSFNRELNVLAQVLRGEVTLEWKDQCDVRREEPCQWIETLPDRLEKRPGWGRGDYYNRASRRRPGHDRMSLGNPVGMPGVHRVEEPCPPLPTPT